MLFPAVSTLRPALGLTHATAMVVGTIIGASIFVQPSEITRQMPSVTGIVGVWLAAGVLTLFGALVCAELASAFPQTGGVYVFLREAYSPAAGFLWGWAMFWSMHSGIIAAIATVFARYVERVRPDGHDRAAADGGRADPVAVRGQLRRGPPWRTDPDRLHGGEGRRHRPARRRRHVLDRRRQSRRPTPRPATSPTRGFLLAMAAGLFAYGGWHMVTYTAGETKDAARTVPRALLLGTLVVTACYAGLNAIYLRVLPLDAVRSSSHVAADAADALFGGGGATMMAALVVISTFGAVNGIILVGPRVYYQMAQDGTMFRWLGAVHPSFGTPHRAIAVQAVWASVLASTNTYGALFSRVIYTEWIFFAAMAAGLMLLRRRPGYQPAYRVWGYPVVPIVFIAVSAAIVVMQISAVPGDSAIGLGLVLIGLPVYFLWSRR